MADSTAKEVLERDIFGGSNSELSSEEDDLPQQKKGQKVRRASPVARRQEYDSSGGESEDDYVQESRPGKTKKRRPGRGDGERRPATRKRKRKEVVEEDLSLLPPEEASKRRLDKQIEAILKPKKSNRPKRKNKDQDEELDRYADEEVSRLREAMLAAAADDAQANREKIPATSKLKLLPQVLDVLRKASLAQSITDNNLLEGVKTWLEPLPDRSLPALDIQREFFSILKKMDFIDTNVLKESKLGRVVLFYTKCKRVTADISRQAHDLVSVWSRPIIKRSASYRDRIIPTASAEGMDGRTQEKLNTILARARESEKKDRVRKNAVSIPQRELGSYTVAPRSDGGAMRNNVSIDVDIERRRRNAERIRKIGATKARP